MRATSVLLFQLTILLALFAVGAEVVNQDRFHRILTSWLYTSPRYEPNEQEMQKVLDQHFGYRYDCDSDAECEFQHWFSKKAEGVRKGVNVAAATLTCLFGALAFWLVLRWVTTVVWPQLKLITLRLTSGMSKDAFAARRMRSADEEFQQLQRLHQSGLVNDEQFAKRKLAIQTRLKSMDV